MRYVYKISVRRREKKSGLNYQPVLHKLLSYGGVFDVQVTVHRDKFL